MRVGSVAGTRRRNGHFCRRHNASRWRTSCACVTVLQPCGSRLQLEGREPTVTARPCHDPAAVPPWAPGNAPCCRGTSLIGTHIHLSTLNLTRVRNIMTSEASRKPAATGPLAVARRVCRCVWSDDGVPASTAGSASGNAYEQWRVHCAQWWRPTGRHPLITLHPPGNAAIYRRRRACHSVPGPLVNIRYSVSGPSMCVYTLYLRDLTSSPCNATTCMYLQREHLKNL